MVRMSHMKFHAERMKSTVSLECVCSKTQYRLISNVNPFKFAKGVPFFIEKMQSRLML